LIAYSIFSGAAALKWKAWPEKGPTPLETKNSHDRSSPRALGVFSGRKRFVFSAR
jgi:hypothetical protein